MSHHPCNGWCDLPQLTASQSSVSLKVNEAVILVSPRNPYELFVVERREKGNTGDPDSLDAAIGGSGLIVYRVDTTVEGLSNYFGKNGIYLFRPQPDQPGYVAQNERQTLNNAFLSLESGRRSIGSSNAASGLSDGALTFSDGSNSGITIIDVSSAGGAEMTFSVSIPDASDYDLWEDTDFNSGYANANLANIGGLQMAVAYDSWGTSLALYQYQGGSWTNIGPVLTDADCINDAVLFELAGSPAVAYLDGTGTLKLKQSTGGGWSDFIAPVPGVSSFDIQQSTDGQTAHLCYVSNSADAYYVSLSAQGSASPILYAGGLLGSPKVVVTDTAIYAAVFDSNQNELVSVYPLSAGDSAFGPAIPSPGNAGAYDLIAYDNTLYFAAGASSQLLVKRYNGTAWEDCAAQDHRQSAGLADHYPAQPNHLSKGAADFHLWSAGGCKLREQLPGALPDRVQHHKF